MVISWSIFSHLIMTSITRNIQGIGMPVLEEKAVIPDVPPTPQGGLLIQEMADSILKAVTPLYLYKPPWGYPRGANTNSLRELAKNPYVFAVIKTIADQIASARWDIMSKDDNKERGITPDDEARRKFIDWFNNPNANDESFSHILRAVVTDICEVDAGVIVKVFNHKGELVQLYARSGDSFLKNPDIYGTMTFREPFVPPLDNIYTEINKQPDTYNLAATEAISKNYSMEYAVKAAYFQYGQAYASYPIPFGSREVVYIQMNPRADDIYGRSPLEMLTDIILTLVYGSKYNLDFYLNNNMPEGIISLEGATQEDVKAMNQRLAYAVRDSLDSVGGRRRMGYRIGITNTPVDFTPFQMEPAKMQVLEQQKWFNRLLLQCYDEKTEVLTSNGWKPFPELDGSEEIARVNPKTLQMDFAKPVAYQSYQFDGDMIHFLHRNLDLMVTPDHSMLANTRYLFETTKELQQMKAEQIKPDMIIPQACTWGGTPVSEKIFETPYQRLVFSGDQWVKFLGFWMADGSATQGTVHLGISKIHYPELYEKITSLLNEIGAKYHEREVKLQWSDDLFNDIYICNIALVRYLKQFGHAKDKFVPREIINSTPHQIKLFLEYYGEGDGCISKDVMRYGSRSKQLLDDCQEMYLRCNIASNVNVRIIEDKPFYELSERKSKCEERTKNFAYLYPQNIRKVPYSGLVYDVTLPEHHFLVVRRNGRVTISGNCFGMTEHEMGITDDINRATGGTQSAVFKRRVIKPITNIIEYHINSQILTEFPNMEGWQFKFDDYDLDEDIKKHTLYEAQIRMGIISPEMIAEKEGIDLGRLKADKEAKRQQEIQDAQITNSGFLKEETGPPKGAPGEAKEAKEKPEEKKPEAKAIRDPDMKELAEVIKETLEVAIDELDRAAKQGEYTD